MVVVGHAEELPQVVGSRNPTKNMRPILFEQAIVCGHLFSESADFGDRQFLQAILSGEVISNVPFDVLVLFFVGFDQVGRVLVIVEDFISVAVDLVHSKAGLVLKQRREAGGVEQNAAGLFRQAVGVDHELVVVGVPVELAPDCPVVPGD